MGFLFHATAISPFARRKLCGLCFCFLFLFLFLSSYELALAQGKNRGDFGDWTVLCDTPPGARGEQCAAVQSVLSENQKNIGLTVSALYTADKKQLLLRVVTALGVWLPSGLSLKLDGKQTTRLEFGRCGASGCLAEAVLQENLLQDLKKANMATFVIFRTPEEGIGFPISLDGFKEALSRLP